MGNLSEHFSREEFVCHCGCGRSIIDDRLIAALEAARGIVGAPLHITSGYRCPEHNRRVGGARKSEHMAGLAADVQCSDLAALYRAAITVPEIKGVGIYLRAGGWIHLDVRERPSRWAEDEKRRKIEFDEAVARLLGRK
jgi:hypothetical protein